MSDNRICVLKIDKDCFVDRKWLREYVRQIRHTCKQHHLTVTVIRISRSRKKGQHFYIAIRPAVSPELANRIQWLLGDDCVRVDFNRARIRSGLLEWNKLFEEPHVRLRTLYRNLRGLQT